MKPLTIITLGPDRADEMTLGAVEALLGEDTLLLRTGRHGAATWLSDMEIPFETLDDLYDGAEDFDSLKERAADDIIARYERGSLRYAVADPFTDETVAALIARGIPLAPVGGDSLSHRVRSRAMAKGLPCLGAFASVAATDVGDYAIDPGIGLLITEINSRLLAGEVKLALLSLYPPEKPVLLGEDILPLCELDRQAAYDHLSCLWVPKSPMTERLRYTFSDLIRIMARLRRPREGCPWDLEQTHESLREYVIEEAYELVEAIDSGDDMKVADELGDVLLQVVFHAQVAKDRAAFDMMDVTTAICHKMITRHAHIFGDVTCETAQDVLRSWEAIKKKEKGQGTAWESMEDIPARLPALMRAGKVQKKARQVGFDWDDAGEALKKVLEEAKEVEEAMVTGAHLEEETGDLLFAVVNVCRLLHIQAELALRMATDKFIARFGRMEEAIRRDGKVLPEMVLAEMDTYWDAVKRAERKSL